ncbi:sulfate transporter 3.4 [Zea mays]|uniref:Sulfate transporter 3.4 n=1 Tax=Zea mays TaxID=4577 RepID=B6SYY9_MAIZE|nr:sulfate transporter 3.4 [Zea mays]ACG30072.1 sulfate transporter 3.4 [Zea mays]ACN34448.1 unknown [Zea mays]|eukprot:NP_001148179.1 sulfate transporter 3.4 [Zea mays]
MVVNNKVDSLSYDVEAPPPSAAGAAAGQAPPPASPAPAPAPATHAPVTREGGAASVLELHKVSLPERRTTAKALRQRLAEVFFPDDPLHQFKNQSSARRLVLALHYFFPIFQWGSAYSPRLLRSDLVAGLTIASLAIPQGISYAKLANLPPIVGLYSSFVPPLIYALLGSSRDLAVGPVSIASLVMGSMLRDAVSPDEQPLLYLQLAFTATFFAGVFQASLGFLRLGFIVDFLSKATLTGFMGGAAVIVSLQQLKGLLGISHFTSHMGFLDVMRSVVNRHDEWKWQTIVMGSAFLAILLLTRQISARNPKLFWVSAGAPLASVIISTILSFIWKSPSISVIGILPRGVNPPSANMLSFSGSYVALTIKTGIMTGILSLTEGIAVGRTFASINNYQVDGNKEMMAIGLMNMAGSCASCYVTTGSFSRSAVNYSAGCRTALSNVVMAAAVLVTLLFLMPLFHYTPNVILAAIIITAVVGLVDVRGAARLWKVDKLDFLACVAAFLGVLLVSVQTGLGVAVGISLFKVLLQVTRPNVVVEGLVPGTQSYRSVAQYREAVRVPGFLVVGVESAVYFANSMYLVERVMRYLRDEEERALKSNHPSIRCVVLDMGAVAAIDTSGLDALSELKKVLDKRNIELVLANPVGSVAERMFNSAVGESFGSGRLFFSVAEAVAAGACKAAQP